VEPGGQRVDARDRLYLARDLPFLLVWGERDTVIPVRHGREVHKLVKGSRLEVMPEAGHFPHLDDPDLFLEILEDFIESTEPAELGAERLRSMLAGGRGR
jgi:pimeloyl-ACP methyl ester carboxylesterase